MNTLKNALNNIHARIIAKLDADAAKRREAFAKQLREEFNNNSNH